MLKLFDILKSASHTCCWINRLDFNRSIYEDLSITFMNGYKVVLLNKDYARVICFDGLFEVKKMGIFFVLNRIIFRHMLSRMTVLFRNKECIIQIISCRICFIMKFDHLRIQLGFIKNIFVVVIPSKNIFNNNKSLSYQHLHSSSNKSIFMYIKYLGKIHFWFHLYFLNRK